MINVPHGRAGHPSEPVTFAKTTPNFTLPAMSQRSNATRPLNEADIQLASRLLIKTRHCLNDALQLSTKSLKARLVIDLLEPPHDAIASPTQ